jgi:hypothetical protein
MSVHVVAHTTLGELHFLGSLGRGGVNLELVRIAKIRIRTATILILNMLQPHVSIAAYNLGKRFTQFKKRFSNSKGWTSVFFNHIENTAYSLLHTEAVRSG